MFSIFPTFDLLDKNYSTFIRPGSLVSKYNNTAEECVLQHKVKGILSGLYHPLVKKEVTEITFNLYM